MSLPTFPSAARFVGRSLARVKAFFSDNHAVSTVEYALITVTVVVVVGTGAAVMSDAFQGLFDDLSDEIDTQTTDAIDNAQIESTGGGGSGDTGDTGDSGDTGT